MRPLSGYLAGFWIGWVLAVPQAGARVDPSMTGAKIDRCIARGSLPDPDCTPGAVEPIDLKTLCSQRTTERREVTEATKRRVFAEYGIPYPSPNKRKDWEIDHLVSLELAGSNDISNLWPEAAEPEPGFRQKDLVENRLHKLVCSGQMTLAKAQSIISTDWLSEWNAMQKEK